jgi:hypothetical protein
MVASKKVSDVTRGIVLNFEDRFDLLQKLQEMHAESLEEMKSIRKLLEKLLEKDSSINYTRTTSKSSGFNIDESVFVTEMDTKSISKGFEKIAQAKTAEDTSLSETKNKLRKLKSGE